MLTCELLVTPKTAKRGIKMLRELEHNSNRFGVQSKITDHYRGDCDLLMIYGPGGPDRFGWYKEHLKSGRHVITWDMGYWNRASMLRVSIDAFHPQEWMWRKTFPRNRLGNLPIRDTYDSNGPVVFAGMGKKSKALFGNWDQSTLARLQQRGSRQVIIRNKPDRLKNTSMPPIEQVIDGASLIVTHHSNVAIDGIIAGIPFECEDGAAKAYRGDRMEFLHQLAWFQWSFDEAPQAWWMLRELL